MLVPMLIACLGSEGYGTWAAISSLTMAISLLDLGFGNSIRNSVAEMRDSSSSSVKKEYIGSFQILLLLGVCAAIIFALIITKVSLPQDQKTTLLLLYSPLLLSLPLLLSSGVLQGARLYGLQSFFQSIPSLTLLCLVAFCRFKDYTPALTQLAATWAISNTVCLFTASLLSLRILNLNIACFRVIAISCVPRDRLMKAMEFFCLQISSLFVYGIGNLLVYKSLGPLEVSRYDVLSKLFQLALSFYVIQIGVYWAEISMAKSRSGYRRLRQIFSRLSFTCLSFSLISLSLAFIAPSIISKWTNGKVHLAISEAIVMAILVSLQAFSYIGAVFMNAFELLRPQIIIALSSAFAMIPLSSYLFSIKCGIISVPVAASTVTFMAAIICIYCTLMILRDCRNLQAANLIAKVKL